MKRAVLLLIILELIIFPIAAQAEIFFNPSFVISDEEMTDHLSLNLAEIQQFLEEKGSSLAWRSFPDYLGVNRPAAEIIWQAAIESKISPKVLLVTLQKEQSLIGDSSPSQNQLDKAMGYRCPDSGSCSPKALGFGKQVDGAAWQFRQYMDNPGDWHYQAGNDYAIDGWLVTPLTKATAGLYNYTPHYSGNNRFWQLWQNYWGRDFPDGSLVKTNDSPAVWLIQYGTRRLITSWGALLSRFDPKKILTISKLDLEKYEIGPSIQFHNYSLLQDPDGKVYLLVDDELRHITSPEVFRVIGFNPEEIEVVEFSDLAGYKYGKDITVETAYPTGALLQDNKTGGVYFVEAGLKHPIYAREIMESRFPKKVLTQVAPEILDQYQTGDPVKFRDGELIQAQGDSKVYVVAGGYRRWVKTEAAFAKFSYKWDNIITTSAQALTVHPLGEDVE
ncbi:MAG: hypothetical protein HUU49_02065 [Candidatus Buchananbacteria bacterium]|nr:hypothetical protein [Candidatus Buchananbacteria bacterium]